MLSLALPGGGRAAGAPGTTFAARAADLFSQGKVDEAIPIFAMAIEADPHDDVSMEGRVRALIVSGRWNEALREAHRYTEALPDSPFTRTALGEALYRAGDFDGAADVLVPLLRNVNADTPAHESPASGGVPPRAPAASTAAAAPSGGDGAPPASPSPTGGKSSNSGIASAPSGGAGAPPVNDAPSSVPSGAAPPPQPPPTSNARRGDDVFPARALLTLGQIRIAEGQEDEGAKLFERAVASSPKDRDVLFWSAGTARTRADAIALLTRYLAVSAGDDPDRIDGAQGAIRLYKALGERRVWVRESLSKRVEIPMQPLLDRDAKITGFVVELALAPAGQPRSAKKVRVLLDSGSTGLFLVERIAQKGGFQPLSIATTFGGGGDGHAITRKGLIPSLAIGDLRFSDALVSTTNQEIEPSGRYHGLLGLSVFDGYLISLDLIRNRLVLEEPPASLGGSPYWTVESQMLVQARTSSGKAGLFLFDTGAVRSLVSNELAGVKPSKSEAAVRGYGGLLAESTTVHGAKLQFQELETPEPTLYAANLNMRSRLGGVEISGFLGLDLLSRTSIEIDTEHRRVLVTKPSKR
jgi:hypothetical protein